MTEQQSPPEAFGACRCGHYRIQVTGQPILVSYCHCQDCRKATGAPVTVFVGFQVADVQVVGNEAAVYQSTPAVQRLFCGECGAPIAYRDSRLPGEIYYYLGVMQDPSKWKPTLHAWTAEKVDWLGINDGLPQFREFSRQR